MSYNLDLRQKKMPEGVNVCVNYEFNLLGHVGAVAKSKGGGDGGENGGGDGDGGAWHA